MLSELPFLPIAELARQLRAGETTSVALVDACLANIDAQDGKLHAFVDVWRDAARRLARAADAEREAGFARGPLHGIPIAVKDLFHVAGRATTAGSASRRGEVSSHTATCVQRLLDAGMIPLGKTHMVEFAYGTWGTNRPMGTPWNPWDLATHRVPGGSSSGSGVAVAAGMAPAALGTDTGGSVRIPAALCGLVGFKPTYGRIPLDGVVPLATSLDSVGPLARTVEDAQRLVAAMAGEPFDKAPPAGRLDGVRITALAPDAFPDIVERAVADAFARMVARLRERGAVVREERVPFDFPALGARNGRLIGIEGYAAHREVIDDAAADVDPGVRDRMLLARGATAAEYLDALARRREAMAAFDDWMLGRDALATPMLPITARAVDAVDETTYPLATWSRAVNYLGACAISVPAPWDGPLPVGLQLVGRAGHDDDVARIAAFAVDGDPLPRPPAPAP